MKNVPAHDIDVNEIPQHVIITTMKNEGPFMLEWVAHNLSIGFDGILIFTNDCSDGTDLIARRLEELGYGGHVPNPVEPGESPQHIALRRSRWHPLVKNASWLMCLDGDEFINVTVGDRTIPSLIEHSQSPDAISLAWRLFGCGGVERYSDTPVTAQFTMADHPTDYATFRAFGIKTLFCNNGMFKKFGPHRPKRTPEHLVPSLRWADGGGNLYPSEKVGWRAWEGFDHSYGRVHHYAVRSIESYLVKKNRGRTNKVTNGHGEDYWRDMNINRVADTSILSLAERAKPILNRLMDDPVLRFLHQYACDWHRSKITELSANNEWKPLLAWLKKNKYNSANSN